MLGPESQSGVPLKYNDSAIRIPDPTVRFKFAIKFAANLLTVPT